MESRTIPCFGGPRLQVEVDPDLYELAFVRVELDGITIKGNAASPEIRRPFTVALDAGGIDAAMDALGEAYTALTKPATQRLGGNAIGEPIAGAHVGGR